MMMRLHTEISNKREKEAKTDEDIFDEQYIGSVTSYSLLFPAVEWNIVLIP